MRSSLGSEKRLLRSLSDWRSADGGDWAAATPSFLLQAYRGKRKILDVAMGEHYPIYDWASLTKIVFSTSSAMFAMHDRELRLGDRLVHWFPELEDLGASPSLDRIELRHLLSHSAGMTWWKPFFKTIAKSEAGNHEEAWAVLLSAVLRDVRFRVRDGSLAKAQKGPAVYSDLDFFLLGEVLRRATLSSFSDRWAVVADRLDLPHTEFHTRLAKHVRPGVLAESKRKAQCAPTERDPWRGRLLKGEVHDENTGALFGVAPHAGLFGPIDDLSRYGLELRKLALGEKSKLPAVGKKFLTRAIPSKQGDWGLGFMMPTKGSASCGRYFSSKSVGHTGFTGTSLWYDPRRDLLVTVLANRVHPSRQNRNFQQLRPALHNMVVEAL